MARQRASQMPSVHFKPPPTQTIAVNLEVRRIVFPQAGLIPLPCPKCRVDLNIHQPDPDVPGRLLGTCGECGTWCALTLDSDHSEARLIVLPRDAST